MLESILSYMAGLDPLWIYATLLFFSFIENVFPPSPSDVVVVIGASIIATTSLGFVPVLIITSVGSSAGFILMYLVGKFFGEKVLRSGRLKFITDEDLTKTDQWFAKYGYKLITANRFLPGTRSVISFFAGVHELNIFKTFLYASISAFLWNTIIIFVGMQLGNNVELIDYYLTTYSKIIVSLTIIVAIIFAVRYFLKKKAGKPA
ncbi:MAG: alkaline phosphatase [Melioribacteraceae bacterium]|nr:MAG: alkaline phosphatase [Melioribacteraceae bacterium]